MRQTKRIHVSLVDMDNWPLNPSTLALVDFMRSGNSVPPIRVQSTRRGRFKILDGRHRVTAHKLLGIKTIMASFSTTITKRYEKTSKHSAHSIA